MKKGIIIAALAGLALIATGFIQRTPAGRVPVIVSPDEGKVFKLKTADIYAPTLFVTGTEQIAQYFDEVDRAAIRPKNPNTTGGVVVPLTTK
jgi:glutathione S-transferase